ncbi:MAG: PhoPQ-activated pathogenicity-related family protein [Planctomycetaceae bacterium]|nr:PhoPQ-activated pathogenicity-related family protein [Planctomycetaceae bacterium]
MSRNRLSLCSLVLFVALVLPGDSTRSTQAADDAVPTELNAYLELADETFHWEILESKTDQPLKSWLAELTSQTWHEIPWKHYLVIVEPQELKYPECSILFITGGRVGRRPSDGDFALAGLLASQSGSYVSLLFQVPNQPLFDNLSEDALIAETLIRAMANQDATWPALFPMAKSAIRAMDATQEVVRQETGREVKRFLVTGASKRGWTTWLTAASGDPRVAAIAPIVIDTLNIPRQMQYQVETWGTWSESIHDYTERDLIDVDLEKMDDFVKRLWKMIDPYSYRSRMTLPKLLVHGTNDPYWTVDATQHYWNELVGPKYILTLPNVGHNLGDKQLNAYATIITFAKNAFQGGSWPEVTWKCTDNNGRYLLTIDSEIPFQSAKLWTAASDSKEFRTARWTSKPVESDSETRYEVTVEKPASGHIAFYVELTSEFDGQPFSVTTQVLRK